ncbi:unnamed protein product [Kluyveromyces dobzhanskii CBS 2104]|uniref:WGS project CCBQ000000000 data, contig 00012 n=1 Tax=Kluyveromyces dobzhanskii CBS 2104 TaxID=1427455 RepID=A0A0A8L0V2_9SACH|nr:unnamed protein product [Kluyveromyces dobzhanskii CBS 2104]
MTVKLIENRVFVAGGNTQARLSSDSSCLYTLNKHALVKVLNLKDPEKEPDIIDVCEEPSTFALSETKADILYVVSRKGDLFWYNVKDDKNKLCFRSSLPLRDLTLIHDDKVCVVGGDDLEMTLVALEEGNSNIKLTLDEQLVSMSYNKQNNILSVSLSNGNIVFYSLSSTTPNKIFTLSDQLPKILYNDDTQFNTQNAVENSDSITIDGLDSNLCEDNRTCTRVAWSNKGDQYAIPAKDSVIKLFKLSDHGLLTIFRPSVTIHSWDALIIDQIHSNTIAAVGNSNLTSHLFIWNLSSGTQIAHETFKYSITSLSWRLNDEKTKLSLIAGTWSGDIITFCDIASVSQNSTDQNTGGRLFVGSDDERLFDNSDIDELSKETSNGNQDDLASKTDSRVPQFARTKENDGGNEGSEDINSDNLFTDAEEDPTQTKRSYNFENEDDFIEDDNGEAAQYKRPKIPRISGVPSLTTNHSRRPRSYQPAPQFQYRPFSTGATPFGNSDKRYLTINQLGHVWTTRNDSGSNSITVSFFDVSRFREYHFDDLFKYDLCSLTDEGILLGQSKLGQIHFKPHSPSKDSWTKTIPLLVKERLTSIACTPSRVIVGTSFGYLRTFNEYGLSLALEKMSPIVALSANEYKVFTVHYSQYHGISYSMFQQHPQTGNKYYQRECPLPIALPQHSESLDDEDETEFLKFDDIFHMFNPLGIKSLFFSSFGDPCIFGHDNVLLVLSRWRSGSDARWVPLVDTNLELWKMSGGKHPKDVHIWPLGLNFDTFSYLLLKGKNCWPDIPMTVPTEMEVRIPTVSKSELKRKEEGDDDSVGNQDVDKNEDVEIPVYLAAEEEFLRSKVLGDLLKDTMDNEGEIYGNESDLLHHLTATHDKSLLRLLAYVCSEQDVDKAASIVNELRQDKALSAARKIAERAELLPLVRKINTIIEAKFENDFNNMQ